MTKLDSTDFGLMIDVKTSDENIIVWDRSRIVKALIRETKIDPNLAEIISLEVEDMVKTTKIKAISTPLIRELVNTKLIEHGLEKLRAKHSRLGIPLYDVNELITQQNKENANIPHNPEATNLMLAGNIKKEFALNSVFPKKVSDAHIKGDLHLHDLDFVDRPYTYDSRESILVKDLKSNIFCLSFQNLFKLSEFIYKENDVEIGILDNYCILDKNNTWSKIKRIVKKPKKRQMFWVKSKNSKSIILTDNHPFIINNNGKEEIKETKDLLPNDFIYVNDNFTIEQNKTILNLTDFSLNKRNVNRKYYVNNIFIILNDNKIKLEEMPIEEFKNLQNKNYVFDLSQGVVYSKSLEGTNKSKELPILFNLTENFCYLLGLFISEGNYEKNTVSLTIGKEYKDEIIKIIEEYKFPYSINKHGNCFRIRIYSSILNDLIYNYFSIGKLSRNICLPNSCISWDLKYSFALLSGIIDGDGCINDKRIVIRCSSRQMLTQIHWLLLSQKIKCCDNLNGGAGSVRYYKGKEIKQNYDIYGIQFGIPENKKYLFKMSKKCNNIESTKRFYYYEKDNIKTIKPIETQEEYIYDITTESGTFICNGILVHNCSGQNLEYVKKFGLNLPNALSIAKPAKHAEVLIAHMLKFSAALQGHFAGAIGWDAVNIFLAPYLVGKKYKEIKQLAQILIFEFSQQAVARGGQAIFSDLNLYWEIPDHFKNVEAIGPEGKYTGYPYGAYLKESQTFIKALFEVYLEGDGSGRPFFFPKPNLHITEKFFKTHGHEEFLELVCEVSSKMGNPYFIFDRGSTVKISECCFHPSQKVLIKGEFGIRHDNISKICNEYNYKNKPINVFYKGEFKEASPIRIEHSNFIKIILENGYELITTDNHICLTNNGEKEAKNLNINDYLPCNNISYKKTEKFNITPSNAISYFMGYFLGSFLGDGCLKYYNNNYNYNTITFSLSKPKQKVIENVIFFAKHFTDNIHINKQNEKNVIFVHITSSILKQFIKEYIKGNSSLKKQLTNKIYNMNYIFQKAFLDGFYDTDGGNNKRTYTFSEKLVKDINALYTLLGVPINITKDTRGKKEGKLSNNVGYVIRPYEQQSKYKERPFFKYFNNQYWFKIKSIEKINYKKPIYSYCFQMEDKKTPYFTLANGIETHNCRMSRKMSTEDLKTEPWKMRFSALQNITINLPRIAYKAKGSNQKLIEQLDKMLELAVKGHIAKKNFIEKILKLKDKGPLALLAMNRDGEPYLIMDKLTYLVGMVGLNEMMKAHYGKELHETDGTLLKGLQIIAHMKQKLEQYSKEYGMHFVLEQTPAESTSYRFAKLDAKDFGEKAVLNGNLESGEIYYTNSTHLNIGEDIDIISRIEKEGRFHPLIEAGSMSHIWLGEHRPPAAALANLVKKIFKHSTSEQVTFSGDFTSCLECFKTSNGLLEECSYCGSKKIDWITRITGYFSKVSGWNAGKKQELLDRKRNDIK